MGFRSRCEVVFLQGIRYLMQRLRCLTVHTTMLTLLKWRLRSPALWVSKKAPQKQIRLLEPTMKVEVTTPEDWMGDVVGDINRRRGMSEGMEDGVAGVKIIRAKVPLSEMFGYATDLRSQTQGRASYSMEFFNYSEAPNNVARAIIESRT